MKNFISDRLQETKKFLLSGLVVGDKAEREVVFSLVSEEMIDDIPTQGVFRFIKENPKCTLSDIQARFGNITHLLTSDMTGNLVQFYSENHARSMALEYIGYWQKAGLKRFLTQVLNEVDDNDVDKVVDNLSRYLSKVKLSNLSNSYDMTSIFEEMRSRAGEVAMTTNRLKKFDAWTGGIRHGQLYVFGGASGSGKSWFALDMALNQILNGRNILFLSTELTEAVMFQRLRKLLPAYFEVGSEELGIEMIKSMDKLRMSSRHIDLGDIIAEIRRDKSAHKTDIVFVDHVQDVYVPDSRVQFDAITKTMGALKDIALQENVAIVAISQLSRTGKDSKDQSGAYLGSGKIEQVAHVAGILTAIQTDTGEMTNNFKLNITKNRGNPDQSFVQQGIIELYRDPHTLSYSETESVADAFEGL